MTPTRKCVLRRCGIFTLLFTLNRKSICALRSLGKMEDGQGEFNGPLVPLPPSFFCFTFCISVEDIVWTKESVQFSSVAQLCPTLRDPMNHSTPGLMSITNSRVHSNSCPSSRWCHPAISSSVVPFSSCPQSLPASGSFPMNQLFAWGGQSIQVSALTSVLPMNTQD